MNKKIIFYPSSEDVSLMVDKPVTSRKNLPEWYTKRKVKINFINDKKDLKLCVPFFDAMSAGYTQNTPCDIYIGRNEDSIFYKPSNQLIKIIGNREDANVDKIGETFYKIEFVWYTAWIPKLPRGYSMLFTHPLNRYDLPFLTLSGIVDSDSFHHAPFGIYPFYIKNSFTGIIPAGTPMFQMIPIKRNSWTSKFKNYNYNDWARKHGTMSKNFLGVYRKNFWVKKSYT